MEETKEGKQVPGSKRKQRRQSSNKYERDMNKFLTIIYHNINRLHEDKIQVTKTFSVPHHLDLCGTQEPPPFMENYSVPVINRLSRRHSDFTLPLSQSERSNSPKTLKRKVVFSDTLTEESNPPRC